MAEQFTRRRAIKDCVCRGCDDHIPKGAEVIYTYSPRQRGQHIYFCIPCGRKIGRMAVGRKLKLPS